MEEEYIENSKPLGKLILLVAFTAIMLITSTYAWFSTQKNVSLSNLYGAVNVAEGLQMSLDASVWVNEINFSDFDQTTSAWTIKSGVSSTKYFNAATTNPSFQYPAGAGGGITNVIPDEYLPASTTGLAGTNDGIGQEILKMYAGDVVNNNTDLQNVDQLSEVPASGYFAFDLFLMNTSSTTVTADTLRLDANSTITADNAGTGIENSARVAFALYENINDDATNFVDFKGTDGKAGTADDQVTGADMTISGNNILSQAQIIAGTSTGKKIKDIAIWEPNANAHTETIVNTNNKLKLTAEDIGLYNNLTTSTFTTTDYLPTYGLTSTSKTKYLADTANPKAIYGIYDWTATGLAKTGFAKQHTLQTSSVASEFATSVNLKSVKKLEANAAATDTTFTIEPNEYQKMRVYVWIEGQDPDCINVASLGGGITLDIGFSKEGSEVAAAEGYVSPSEIFDSTGNVAGKLHIGDFVNYNAGTWTQGEIDDIQTGMKTDLVTANGSTDLPETNFQFGGFAEGTSRNGNATPYSTTYNYVKDKSTNEAITGWRVFDIDGDKITLISAGNPEDYYHGTSAYMSEYILSGNANTSWSTTEANNYQKRDWSIYVNENQKAESATVLTKSRLDSWYSKYIETGADTYEDSTFQKIYQDGYYRYQNMIENYSYYWLSAAHYSGFVYGVFPDYRFVRYDRDGAYGVRVLVSLKSDIKITEEPTGTKTVTGGNTGTYGGDQTYNIWGIQ